MRGSTLSAVVVSLGLAGIGAHGSAQAPAAAPAAAVAGLRQLVYLKASNAEGGDHFGCGGVLDGHAGYGAAMSADGATIAIGAPHESSAARGINGNQNDNSAQEAGAAYVFSVGAPSASSF